MYQASEIAIKNFLFYRYPIKGISILGPSDLLLDHRSKTKPRPNLRGLYQLPLLSLTKRS